MKILLSNDDGIGAPGLEALKAALAPEHDLTIVAPACEKSASGHALTLKKDINYQQIAANEYAVEGFPADCVAMGILGILKDNPPDLVISGINRGGNLGQDSYYSGTVAAAREAIFRGIPAIAISLVIEYPNSDLSNDHFESATNFLCRLLEHNFLSCFDSQSLLNINVPNLPPSQLKGCGIGKMGFRKRRLEMEMCEGVYRVRGGDDGFEEMADSDCQLIADAKISLSPLNLFLPLADKNNAWRKIVNTL